MVRVTERKPLIVGNWKMNANHLEAIQMVQKLSYRLEPEDYDQVEVVVAPPFTALRSTQVVIDQDHMRIRLGAQDVHWEESGAYTGEVSAPMLAKLSVAHVIVGHSERRQYFGESDEMVSAKTRAVIAAGMSPVICVGETAEEKDANRAEEVVSSQVEAAIGGVSAASLATASIAYEPVWAIGTGRNAMPEDAGQMAELIRDKVREQSDSSASEPIRVLYGGSVSVGNIKDFMAKRHIDGALVGGASLDPDTFAAIVRYRI
jgi:triosephosphate isomerase